MKITQCSSCGAPIAWFRTPIGKWMPLDPEPTSRGNLVLRARKDGRTGALLAEHAGPAHAIRDEPLYTSHFATCPNAEKHRRRDKRTLTPVQVREARRLHRDGYDTKRIAKEIGTSWKTADRAIKGEHPYHEVPDAEA